MDQVLNYGKHWIDKDDISEILKVLNSDFITQGPCIANFESAMADYLGAQYAVAVANGTAALHLAVKALNLEQGMEGITSPITFVASSNCFLYNGLKPVFADIEKNTYCIDPIQIERRLSSKTAVIVPVHFAGQPCEMDQISSLALKNRISIIEDAAHAIGSRYKNGKKVGSCYCSQMTIFSFHPVKTIATGEGGLITTNTQKIYEKLLQIRNHGITKDQSKFNLLPSMSEPGPWYYEMQELGFNYRMTDIQAALGMSQLKKIDSFIKRRRQIVDAYNNAFVDFDWLTTPYEAENVFSAFHLYVLKIDFEKINKSRTQVMQELRSKGVGTQVHYIPVHLQPYYRKHFGYQIGDYPQSEHYYQQCLSIPLYPKMTDKDVMRVIQAVSGILT
jgi:UDP-4-amino-4,6-dideoxy-N-acetyl-beta-L-altrosamine transaminase